MAPATDTLILNPSRTELGRRDIKLVPANSGDAAAWDAFVHDHPEGRFSHLWGYKQALEQAYGYQCAYYTISDGELAGVFPSVVVRRGSGCLISQPFSEYGGPLTRHLADQQVKLLPQLLMDAAGREGCRSIEIRGGVGCEAMASAELCAKHPLHSYAVLNIGRGEELWRKALTNEARKGVKRARKAGLEARVQCGLQAIEDPFYGLYLRSMKRLGVPPHSGRFFGELAKTLGARLVAAWVRDRTEPAAVLLGAVSGRRLQIFVTASEPRAWSLRPNDLAHWELIQWAVSEGLQTFDFGSARYASQVQFKKKWGVSLHDYCYFSIGPTAAARRLKTRSTSSPVFALTSQLWRWVLPNALAPVLGPPIRRYLTK